MFVFTCPHYKTSCTLINPFTHSDACCGLIIVTFVVISLCSPPVSGQECKNTRVCSNFPRRLLRGPELCEKPVMQQSLALLLFLSSFCPLSVFASHFPQVCCYTCIQVRSYVLAHIDGTLTGVRWWIAGALSQRDGGDRVTCQCRGGARGKPLIQHLQYVVYISGLLPVEQKKKQPNWFLSFMIKLASSRHFAYSLCSGIPGIILLRNNLAPFLDVASLGEKMQ